MSSYILAIDQGTTGTTVMIVDAKVNVLAQIKTDYTQYFPQPGWVEHDPDEIWDVTLKTVACALESARISGHDIAAIGITNQRETSVLWDKTSGVPVHPAIVWQDRRTASLCEKLRKRGLEKTVRQKTGLVLDPYFSATKIQWMFDNVPIAPKLAGQGRLAFGTIDSYLTWKLTGGKAHVTDATNASRTLLMNLKTLAWDKDLLKLFRVPESILPEIRSCSEIYGKTKSVPGLPDGIPVAGMAGDQQAALFGQACFSIGEAKCTYGTGSFLLMNIGTKLVLSKSGLITTVAWQLGNEVVYALEGSSFIAGAVVQWLRDGLGMIGSSNEIERLANSVEDNGGVFFVPALAGLGAPYWNPHARGVISGITRGTQKGHVARAALEGIAFSQYDILKAMEKDSGKKLKTLKVDGGASANNRLMQFQSDILSCEIVRPQIIHTTALGSAFLAGLAVGFWRDQKEIRTVFKVDQKFAPHMKPLEKKLLVKQWETAIARCQN